MSIKVREAVDSNEVITDARRAKEIRSSIIAEVIDHLLKTFGGVGRPKISEIREIVNEMGFHYPAMFKEDRAMSGYGLGGKVGLGGLANQMLDTVNLIKNIFGS